MGSGNTSLITVSFSIKINILNAISVYKSTLIDYRFVYVSGREFVNIDCSLLPNCDVKYQPPIGRVALSLLASCTDNTLCLLFSLTHPGSEQPSNGY